MNKELESLITLVGTPHLGSVKIRLLIHYFGSAEAANEANIDEIRQFPGFNERVISSILTARHSDFAKRELELVERYKVNLISFRDAHFPKKLLEISDFPVLLYMKGQLKNGERQSLAVVGTRHMSIYGGEMAEKISLDLTSYGFTVVSGLARGIDTVAHKAALKKGRTIAVIGSGLADIYPRENSALADNIIEKGGALLSEFPMTTPPDRQNFPQRNRIVSGMTLGTVLIEAPLKSGAMITMEKAMEQNRNLYAIPGRIDQENFKGNHHLIKNRMAKLVENGEDIVEDFGQLFPIHKSSSVCTPGKPFLEKEEVDFLSKIPQHELSFEEILQITQLPVTRLNVIMMSLIIKKAIKEFPGKIYKKIN